MIALRTLGTLDLRTQGEEARAVLVQPRRVALLVVLALSRPYGFQRRDRLAAMFWPEENEERARASLSRAIYFLRSHLGDAVIINRGPEEIAIDEARLQCDVRLFMEAIDDRREADALNVYDGELLPAFFVSGAPGFEEWLESERAFLRRRAAMAAGALADIETAAGRVQDAVRLARRAMELAPFDEVTVRQLLAALDRTGDRAGAASVFQDFTRALSEQLGVEPAPETRALALAIREREASHAGALLTSLPGPGPDPPGSAPQAPPAAAPSRRFFRVGTAAAVGGAVLVILLRPWALQSRIVDASRVDVTAFTVVGSRADTRRGVAVQRQMLAHLAQAEVLRTIPSQPNRGWFMSVPPESLAGRSLTSRAGTLVSGSWRESAASIHLDVLVLDRRRNNRQWKWQDSASRTDSLELVRRMAARVSGAVAVISHPYYGALLPLVGQPPAIDAWREFVDGLRLEAGHQWKGALERYRLAVSLDPAFTWPLVHAGLALTGGHEATARSDSLIGALHAVRDRVGSLELHLLDYIDAKRSARWDDAYTAIHAAANIAPAEFSYAEATSAQQLHHPGAVIAALTRPEARAAQPGGPRMYWNLLTGAYHDAGDHDRELASVRVARHTQPANAMLLMQELRALVALGRLKEIGVRVDSLVQRPRDDWVTAGSAITMVGLELRAHGHEAEAREVLDRAIAWYRARPAAEQVLAVHRYFMGDALYQADHLEEAESVFAILHREQPDETEHLGYLGVIALRRGNVRLARDIDGQLALREHGIAGSYDGAKVWRAAMAALRADSATTMRLLTESFGPNGTVELHTNRDFDRVRTYAPFRDFVRPRN